MNLLVMTVLGLAVLYLGPQAARGFRALTLILGAGLLVSAGLWFGWVEQQTHSIGRGVAGLFIIAGTVAIGMGVAVRGVVLLCGWQGMGATLAVVAGAVPPLAWAIWEIWLR